MKFGYRERVVLLIASVIIILGVGFFVFIKPKYDQMKDSKKACETAETNWNTKKATFDKIPTMQETIKTRYQKAYDQSLYFTDEMDATELDQFLQEKFMNTEENILYKTKLDGSLSVTDEATQGLSFYYYTPSIVTYPLYEAADLNGSYAKETAKKLYEPTVLMAKGAQTVGGANASFTVRISKKDAFAFIDGVRDYAIKNKDAMQITSLTFSEYDFNGGDALERDEEGKITGSRPENLKAKYKNIKDEDLGYTNVTVAYVVYYMQEPNEPDVGAAYNASIWDGNEWRTWSAQ
jgi:hypothetical protein